MLLLWQNSECNGTFGTTLVSRIFVTYTGKHSLNPHCDFADGHSTENMRFLWRSDAVTVSDDIELPQFNLENFSPYNCDRDIFGSKSLWYTLVRDII